MTYLNDVSLRRLNEVKLVKRIQKKKLVKYYVQVAAIFINLFHNAYGSWGFI